MPDKGGGAPKKDQLASVHVTARLALSPGGAVELANALGAMLKSLSEVSKRQLRSRRKLLENQTESRLPIHDLACLREFRSVLSNNRCVPS
jgi:hypothetical protein